MKLPLTLFAAILCAIAAPCARGLGSCTDINSNPTDYKVVLDDLAAAAGDAEVAALNRKLRFNLDTALAKLKETRSEANRDLNVPLILVNCPGRRPSPNGGDFTNDLVDLLSDKKVVLEVWGLVSIENAVTASDATTARTRTAIAKIGYALPTVQSIERNSPNPPAARHIVNYPKPGATGAIEELESLPEITAFALVGLGADAAHANRYDLAAWAFNEASTAIGNVKKAGTNADVEALLAYVTLRACETRNRARKDSNYHGAIKINRALENCGAAP